MARINSSKTDVTHAEGLQALVGVYFTVRQGAAPPSITADLQLTFDRCTYQVESDLYEVSAFSGVVTLHPENCEPKVSTLYEHWLAQGGVEEKQSAKALAKRSFSGSIGASLKSLMKREGDITSEAAASGSNAQEKETTSQQSNRIELIRAAGQNSWRVGRPGSGDPRRADGFLSGSYFNEIKDSPLCVLDVQSPTVPLSVTLSISIPLTQLVVTKDGSQSKAASVVGFVRDGAQSRGANAAKQHALNVALLKARMAGMALAKKIRASQEAHVKWLEPGSILVALQTYSQEAPTEMTEATNNDKS